MAQRTKTREITIVDKAGTFNTFFKRFSGEQEEYDFEGLSALRKLLSNQKAKILHTIKTKNPNFLTWKGKGKSKIMIRIAGASTVDIRHYVESRNFTGFTRRGFNLNQDQFIEFLNSLVEAINSASE